MGHFAELFVFNDFNSFSFRAVTAHLGLVCRRRR